MRLIDADKLLRDIEHYNLSDGKFQHWVEIQPTVEPEPHWIPCSERQPEDKQKCLVTVKEPWGSCIDLARFAADLHSVDEYDFHDREESGWYYFEPDLGYTELTDVIAWQKLPEPYQPKEKSE